MAYTVDVTRDPTLERINELIGETINEMIKSGASMGAVGAFAQNYPTIAQRLMGAPSAAPTVDLDLGKIIEATVARTLEMTGKRSPGKPRSASGGWVAVAKVNLTIGGKRTSATLPKELLDSIERMAGSRKAAKQVVEDAAHEMPQNVQNRSGWLASRLASHALAMNSANRPPLAH